jgi:RNase P subunit RPR2
MKPVLYKDKAQALIPELYMQDVWIEAAVARRKCQGCETVIVPGEQCLCHEQKTRTKQWPHKEVFNRQSYCWECGMELLGKRIALLKKKITFHRKMINFLKKEAH